MLFWKKLLVNGRPICALNGGVRRTVDELNADTGSVNQYTAMFKAAMLQLNECSSGIRRLGVSHATYRTYNNIANKDRLSDEPSNVKIKTACTINNEPE